MRCDDLLEESAQFTIDFCSDGFVTIRCNYCLLRHSYCLCSLVSYCSFLQFKDRESGRVI